MTETEFRSEIKNLHGGYLFFGGEDYLKYSYSKQVQNAILDGTFDEFNHIVIYAEEYDSAILTNAIMSLPMMADKKLVEVRGVNFNALKKDELQGLEAALASLEASPHTILIIRADDDYFNAGRLPRSPSEIYKLITKYLTPVEFEFPTQARLKSWIMRHFSDGGVEIKAELCDKLVSICGHDMWALSNEIDKLCAYARFYNKKEVAADDIDSICCQTIEYDDFQLTNALLSKDKDLVFETLRRQKSAHEPPFAILSSVVRMYADLLFVQKLAAMGQNKLQIAHSLGIHEFKVGKYLSAVSKETPKRLIRALDLCQEADLKSKSASNVVSYIAVERLISSLCALFCR